MTRGRTILTGFYNGLHDRRGTLRSNGSIQTEMAVSFVTVDYRILRSDGANLFDLLSHSAATESEFGVLPL